MFGLASAAAAQFGGFGRGRRVPPRLPTEATFGHGFNFCRGVYTSGRAEAGGQGWSTDYPDADLNFSIRLSELTRTRVALDGAGFPEFVTVPLTDPLLFQCPYLHMADIGTAAFTEDEVEALRAYLLKGGFIWTDDAWGSYAWDNWVTQMARVLPVEEYQFQDLPLDHPLFRVHFNVESVPQIPSIQFWRTSGGYSTSERGADSATPLMRVITDRHGNIMVLSTHNTDISDAWEREGEDPTYFYNYSPDGYAVGINVVLYAMTH